VEFPTEVRKMQNFNLEKWIIINSDKTITLEEEKEIMDLAKQVLKRKDENRKIFIVEDINFIAKEYL
jgi:hypothetical protein